LGLAAPTAVSEILNTSDIDFEFPHGLSFFQPYLQYFIKENLEVGGQAYLSRAPDGTITGLLTYDDFEKTGAIYTRSRQVFDYFSQLKPFNSFFAEMKTKGESETYDIYTVNLEHLAINHRFSHEISIAEEGDVDGLEQFMLSNNPGMNRKWVSVALKAGDNCFFVRLGKEIAGLGWLSNVKGIGRLHSLFVKPQFRKIGIAEDILYSRLLWLRSKHARLAFSEISRENYPSSKIATKGNMTVSGQVFQYFKKNSDKKIELK
jgi:hypothetical protein